MKPCRVFALQNVTWKCNWKCNHCYFRMFGDAWKRGDTPLESLKREVDGGKERGCHTVVLGGKGEPTLHSQVDEIIDYITRVGMKSLIITNGSTGIRKYKKLFNLGLNHLQISTHALGKTLDKISGVRGAGKKQSELLKWMGDNDHPFRVNITLQQLNYKEIYDTAIEVARLGAFHISFLNFLPHFHWKDRAESVAVDPALLVEPLERAMTWLEKRGVLFSLRYFPACMVKPRFWKYISNMLFVLFDPWEWEYGRYSPDQDKVWEHSLKSMRKTGIKGKPCISCRLWVHCGGWNKYYARAFDYKGLKAIKEIPPKYEEVIKIRGGLFDMNPANLSDGYVE